MLQDAFPTSLERVEDIPAELAAAECALASKQQQQQQPGGRTRVEVQAFRVPGMIRMARAAVLSTTPTALPPQVRVLIFFLFLFVCLFVCLFF
jgi:hypothetical protein